MTSIPVWKTMNVSQDKLRQIYESALDATATIKGTYVDANGIHDTVIDMTEGLTQPKEEPKLPDLSSPMDEGFTKSVSFWAGKVLPPIPEIHIPDTETGFTPRSKL
jgi:hypothetical protein